MVHRNIPHITLCLDNNVRRNLKSELDGQYAELYIYTTILSKIHSPGEFFVISFYYLIIDRRWIDFHNAVWIFQFYFYISLCFTSTVRFQNLYTNFVARDLTSWYTNKTIITSFFGYSSASNVIAILLYWKHELRL